ncbi:endonuclease VIII [Brevibacillus humidisoli]|uniref:Fpg/Nei family DNA glycosylase n=1 Tax=Brevibacillus humidisoli TaxID=2895522 RepID=UPI001E4F5997|nr:DNA-formamidopyrimidine glycosylase family protein [Brevibacillus humidisoli]UFJ40242.1 endonuclease VIII [Brevibacillus humidisoli]
MPELPEMETYRKLLTEKISGRRITRVMINREKSVNLPVAAFVDAVQQRSLLSVERRAKHLLFRLDNGTVLLLHLMLGGFLYYGSQQEKLDRTAQVVLCFGEDKLFFHGLRLGYLHLLSTDAVDEKLDPLGPEPLALSFDEQSLRQRLVGKRGMLKPTLTDQSFIAGIGNCYSDEICFQAQLKPMRKCNQLQEGDIARLYRSITGVLTKAVSLGGYMENPLFAGDSLTGGYNRHCLVYDREGEPCLRCGSPIRREKLSARKTFFCPVCQA